jgi:hypothetical protein
MSIIGELMKITENNRKLFKEIHKKYNLAEDGLLSMIFKKRLKKKLDNDKDLQQALRDADIELDKIRDFAKKAEDKGIEVPQYLKRYL